LILLGALFLPSVAPASQQDFWFTELMLSASTPYSPSWILLFPNFCHSMKHCCAYLGTKLICICMQNVLLVKKVLKVELFNQKCYEYLMVMKDSTAFQKGNISYNQSIKTCLLLHTLTNTEYCQPLNILTIWAIIKCYFLFWNTFWWVWAFI
jgi:hypothetical protein